MKHLAAELGRYCLAGEGRADSCSGVWWVGWYLLWLPTAVVRARGSGRNPVVSVLLLWLLMFGGFMVGSFPGYLLMAVGGPFLLIPLGAIAGGLLGALLAAPYSEPTTPDRPA